ncbi:hypothetical protein HPG69_009506 [Diceros bicornis minor]|uniref:Uncharacterized protein n=1 Tax=Diceros bicornis minor TaxID=77932 RepID=A0A7J7F3A2_DICBM|nr:hypothetical protein HPG69_009506 [Diceros bicornis minor]
MGLNPEIPGAGSRGAGAIWLSLWTRFEGKGLARSSEYWHTYTYVAHVSRISVACILDILPIRRGGAARPAVPQRGPGGCGKPSLRRVSDDGAFPERRTPRSLRGSLSSKNAGQTRAPPRRDTAESQRPALCSRGASPHSSDDTFNCGARRRVTATKGCPSSPRAARLTCERTEPRDGEGHARSDPPRVPGSTETSPPCVLGWVASGATVATFGGG